MIVTATPRVFLEGRGERRRHGAAPVRLRRVFNRSAQALSLREFRHAHDGFTLMDVVSYNDKHNEANGENNHDGSNDNRSWNCGAEGPTDDPEILALRERQLRNFSGHAAAVAGTPMLLAGDEFGRTQVAITTPIARTMRSAG